MLEWLIFKNYLLSRRSGALVRIIAWHCILGIGLGVAALVIVLSVMNGFNLTIRNRMLSVEPHIIITTPNRPTLTDVENLQRTMQTVAPVEQIDRFEAQDLILRSVDGVFGGAVAKGYEAPAIDGLLKRVWRSTKQEAPEPQNYATKLNSNEVILGLDLARSLGIFEGDDVLLIPPESLLLPKGEVPRLQKFKVRSLVSTQMPEVDSKLIFYNLSAGPSKVKSLSLATGFEIRLTDPHDADRVKAELLKKNFTAETWMDRDTSLFFALKMESFAMSLFLSLAVLITSFSIVIVMVLLMSQKRRDIGMLMALGLSKRRTQLRVSEGGPAAELQRDLRGRPRGRERLPVARSVSSRTFARYLHRLDVAGKAYGPHFVFRTYELEPYRRAGVLAARLAKCFVQSVRQSPQAGRGRALNGNFKIA